MTTQRPLVDGCGIVRRFLNGQPDAAAAEAIPWGGVAALGDALPGMAERLREIAGLHKGIAVIADEAARLLGDTNQPSRPL